MSARLLVGGCMPEGVSWFEAVLVGPESVVSVGSATAFFCCRSATVTSVSSELDPSSM